MTYELSHKVEPIVWKSCNNGICIANCENQYTRFITLSNDLSSTRKRDLISRSSSCGQEGWKH